MRSGLYTVAMGLTLLSDTFTMLIAVIAVLIVCLLGIARRETYEDLGLTRVAIATVVSVALAGNQLAHARIGRVRDRAFTSQRLPFQQTRFAFLWQTRGPWRLTCPRSTGANSRSAIAGQSGPSVLAAWPGRLCWLTPSCGAARRGGIGPGETSPVTYSGYRWRWGSRRFLPAQREGPRDTAVHGPVHALRGGVDRASDRQTASSRMQVLGILGVLAAVFGVTVAWDLQKAPANDSAIAIASWLDDHGLNHGYGPYWDASIVTASGAVALRSGPFAAVTFEQASGVIEPFRWMSDRAWYHDRPANFVVFKRDPSPKFGFLINEPNCVAWFGDPSARYTVGPYVVLVWDHDLRPFLVRDLPWIP